MMATDKIFVPKGKVGYGFVGVWSDNTIGWMAPNHVSRGRRNPEPPNEKASEFVNADRGNRFFLCKITIEPIRAKNGRPITKIVRRKKK